MLFTTVLAALVASVAAAKDTRTFAVLRHYGQGPLTTCRADPIVSPGSPSAHVHTVMGASNFGLNVTGEQLRQSRCTTAMARGDLSSYWFPTLYFQDPETGLLEQVKLFYMNVYYFFDATNDDIKAFPVGLQIVSGDAQLRTAPSTSGAVQLDPSKGPIQPVQITCPRTNFNPPSWPADSDGSMAGIQDPQNHGSGIGFPFQDCDGYASPMRVDVHFPSCYNPEAGLTDYKNNMRFPTPVAGGKLDCPPGWIHVPHMFYETYWDTHALAPRFQHLNGKASPFVFSNGDTTGFSAHADFISGWDEEELQHIIDTCDAGHAGIHSCPGLKYGANDDSGSCNIKCPVDEVIDGKLEKLPGNNPLAGWGHGGGNLPAPSLDPVPSTSLSAEPSLTPGTKNHGPKPQVTGKPTSPPVKMDPAPPVSAAAPPPPPPPPSPTTLITVPSSDNSPTSEAPPPPPETTHRPGYTRTVYDTVTVWQTTTVYHDGSSPAPTLPPQDTSAAADEIAGSEHVGCYKDSANRALNGKVLPNISADTGTGPARRSTRDHHHHHHHHHYLHHARIPSRRHFRRR
ncbi:hypothetical protein VTK26DRAFT_3665 [Humicola hyalothermophila]